MGGAGDIVGWEKYIASWVLPNPENEEELPLLLQLFSPPGIEPMQSRWILLR